MTDQPPELPGVTLDGEGELILYPQSKLREVVKRYADTVRTVTCSDFGEQSWRDSSFDELPGFVHLEHLTLFVCAGITDLTLVQIGKCARLKRLDMSLVTGDRVARHITPVGVRHLGKLRELELLKLPMFVMFAGKKSALGAAVAQLEQQLPMCVIQNKPLI